MDEDNKEANATEADKDVEELLEPESEVGFSLDKELKKLPNPPPVTASAYLMEKYGFVNDGANPSSLYKWKGEPFDDSKCMTLFDTSISKDGKNGYPWKGMKWRRLRKRIQELLLALFQSHTPSLLITHRMVTRLALEEMGELMNWAAYGKKNNVSQWRGIQGIC